MKGGCGGGRAGPNIPFFLTFFRRLVNAYAQSAGISPASIRLTTPDGDRMNQQQNLGFYDIRDGDQLDVMIEQIGGRRQT